MLFCGVEMLKLLRLFGVISVSSFPWLPYHALIHGVFATVSY